MSTELQPKGDCPKCGAVQAFERPRFVPDDYIYETEPYGRDYTIPEHLVWSCRWCGYEVHTETVERAKERAAA